MQKWLLVYYCKISLISLILQKTIIIQRNTLTQARPAALFALMGLSWIHSEGWRMVKSGSH